MVSVPVSEDEWRAALSALLDGEQPRLAAHDVAVHLASCGACSAWLDQAMALNRQIRELPVIQPQLGERMVDAVDVRLCGCHTGGACACHNCQCGASCTCHTPAS